MQGASKWRIRLNRVNGISDAEWDLLSRLWFWLVTKGTSTHTFGYIRSEFPDQYRGPLVSWIATAMKPDGRGSEPRQTLDGEVIRVNVTAASITIDDGLGGGAVV